MVVYKAIYDRPDSQIWVRPEKMFLEKIPSNRPDNITGQIYRFELCNDIEKDYGVHLNQIQLISNKI